MSKLANRVDALNSLNKLAQKAKPASALRNLNDQGLNCFFGTAHPTGVMLGRATAAHAKVEHGNHRNSFKSQRGNWLKARNLDTVQKARADTSDHPNKITKSVNVTSIFSESNPSLLEPPTQIEGNLKHHLQDWQKITNDPWVLEAILGYRIQFASLPVQQRVPRPRFMTQEEEKALQQEVESLMMKGAIKETRFQGGFISNIQSHKKFSE